MTQIYDPKQVTASWGNIANMLVGVASGSFITADRDVKAFSKSTGALGDSTIITNHNISGVITVTYKAAAKLSGKLNDIVSGNQDRIDGVIVMGDFHIEDFSGTTVVLGVDAVLEGINAVDFGDDEAEMVITWLCDLRVMGGGSKDIRAVSTIPI